MIITRLNLTFLLLFPITYSLLAQQPFQNLYLSQANTGIDGRTMIMTQDSGYIMVGRLLSSTNNDAFVCRTNSNGDTLWTRYYGGSAVDAAECIYATSDGGFIICGQTYSFGNDSEMMVLKINSTGNVEWSKTYGGPGSENALCMIQTSDGGYLLGGNSSTNTSGATDAALLRLDSTGTILWTKRFGRASDPDQVEVIREMPDGGFLVGGNSANGNFWQIFLMRTDPMGDSLWTKTFAIYSIGVSSIEFTSNGGFLLAGTLSNFSQPSGILIQTDSLGNKLWSSYYGGNSAGFDSFSSIKSTNDGGFILTGFTNTWGFGDDDMLIVKIDATGDVQWSKVYGQSTSDKALDIFQTGDGGFTLFGNKGVLNSSKFHLIKTDSFGNSICTNLPVTVIRNNLTTTSPAPAWSSSIGWSDSSVIISEHNYITGVNTTCISVGMSELSEGNQDITISPNPVSSHLTIHRTMPFSDARLLLINCYGQIVKRFSNLSGHEIAIPTDNLDQGLYFAVLLENDFEINRSKFIVIKY